MKSKKVTIAVMVISFITIFMSLSFVNNEVMSFKGENPVVIFDIGHQQIFNNTHMQSAIDYLEEKYEANVFINEDEFTPTNLRGADLLILLAPNYEAVSPYTDLEKLAVKEYIENEDSSSILFLANPYFFEPEMRNLSSSIIALNSIMSSNYGILNLQQGKTVLMNDFDYRFDDQRFLYIDNQTIDTTNPIIQGFSEVKKVNEILSYSTRINTISGGERFINTTSSTYYLSYQNDPAGNLVSGSVQNHSIIVSNEDANGRAIVCGSAIMFSDIAIPGASMSWYEAYDNAQLWENMIAWLFYQIPIQEKIQPIPEFGIFTLFILGIFLLFIVVGAVFYTAGKEVKRAEVSETIQKMREKEDKKHRTDKEIEEAFYAEDELAEDEVEIVREEKIEEKEVDMKTISEEVRKKPPKTRTRSERRRRN
ncbi:MAG TPA: hypothetical protein VMX55_03465 [candidate division Zixibacteria bacterium]|nr:hypothetical protein [candidate division Zixibacteria bacterium]